MNFHGRGAFCREMTLVYLYIHNLFIHTHRSRPLYVGTHCLPCVIGRLMLSRLPQWWADDELYIGSLLMTDSSLLLADQTRCVKNNLKPRLHAKAASLCSIGHGHCSNVSTIVIKCVIINYYYYYLVNLAFSWAGYFRLIKRTTFICTHCQQS